MIITAQNKKGVNWLNCIRRYLVIVGVTHLLWEVLQMPFYTMWQEGTWMQISFAIIHCTGGDVLISMSSLTLAIILIGSGQWPDAGFRKIAFLTVLFGVAYLVYSEWLNVNVYQNWSYSQIMPVLVFSSINIGLLPLLQWMIIPPIGLWVAIKMNAP